MNAVISMILLFGMTIGIAIMVGLSTSANALDNSRDTGLLAMMEKKATASDVSDFSARKKRRHVSSFPFAVIPPGPYAYRANPNYGPGTAQFQQARRQGRCVMDEGYGRWTACSNK